VSNRRYTCHERSAQAQYVAVERVLALQGSAAAFLSRLHITILSNPRTHRTRRNAVVLTRVRPRHRSWILHADTNDTSRIQYTCSCPHQFLRCPLQTACVVRDTACSLPRHTADTLSSSGLSWVRHLHPTREGRRSRPVRLKSIGRRTGHNSPHRPLCYSRTAGLESHRGAIPS